MILFSLRSTTILIRLHELKRLKVVQKAGLMPMRPSQIPLRMEVAL